MIKWIWFLLFTGLLVSCQPGGAKMQHRGETGELIDLDQVRINIQFLASDALEGREAASNAEKVASLYLASELEKYGVLPYDSLNNSYFQNIDMRVVSYRADPEFEIVDASGKTLHRFQQGVDFVGYPRYYQTIDTIAPLVFAGYGITAEEYDYDDYKNIDAMGKVVVLFPGEPASEDTSYFAGEERTTYSDLRSKVATAKSHGAIGVVGVSDRLAQYGWDSFKQFASNKRYTLKDDPIKGNSVQLPVTFSNSSTLKKLFELAGYTDEDSDRFIADNIPPPSFVLPQMVKILWGFDTTGTAIARNVIGVIPGTDPNRRHEYVTLGAHYDHVGIGLDGVHNGADDNSSGTVALLEIARLFAKYGQNKRSILFTFHTAEEKGLLGSRYFTEHADNIDDFVAHINLDMIGRGDTDSIYCIGSDKISMEYHELVKKVNYSGSAMCLDYSLNDPADPMRLYYRSDHYNFAKKGVPSVFFFDFEMTDYHQPGDDYEKINLVKIGRVTRLVYELALAAANKEGRFKIIEDLAD